MRTALAWAATLATTPMVGPGKAILPPHCPELAGSEWEDAALVTAAGTVPRDGPKPGFRAGVLKLVHVGICWRPPTVSDSPGLEGLGFAFPAGSQVTLMLQAWRQLSQQGNLQAQGIRLSLQASLSHHI